MQVSVVGENTIEVPPELGILHLTAGFEGEAKHDVVEATITLVRDLSGELEAVCGPEGPASSFSVGALETSSWRPANEQGQLQPLRHSASVAVRVKYRDFDALSVFAARNGRRTGCTLGFVDWKLTETTLRKYRDTASAAAVVEARARALVIAKAAGFTYVMPSELADPGLLPGTPGGGGEQPLMALAKMEDSRGGSQLDPEAIDLKPEHIVVTATVHARFTAG